MADVRATTTQRRRARQIRCAQTSSRKAAKAAGACAIIFGRPLVTCWILNGEIEWLKEHAWKTIPATLTERILKYLFAIQSTTSRHRMLLDVNP